MILGIDNPIDLRQKNKLVASSSDRASEIRKEAQGAGHSGAGRRNSPVGERRGFRRTERGRYSAGSTGVGHRWERAQLLIRTEEEKQLVFDDRSADSAPKLMPLVFRQERHQNTVDIVFLERIDGPPIAAPVIPKRLSVNLIRSALRHGVYHSARRASIFRRVIRSVDLEFLNRSLAARITDARPATLFAEKRLVIVGPIYRVVVQQSGNSAEAHQPKSSVWHRTRRT